MSRAKKTFVVSVFGCGTGLFFARLVSGNGVTDALLWGVAGGVAGAAVLWLAGFGREGSDKEDGR